MKRIQTELTPLAAAVVLALGSAPAVGQEMLEIDDLVNPQSSIRAGVGYIDRDSRWYGRYRGLLDSNESGIAPLLDLEYVTRDNDSGTWARAKISTGDVRTGLVTPGGVNLEYGPQGDWGVALDYQRTEMTEIPRFTTGLLGIGSANMTSVDILADPTAARTVDLEMERDDVRFEVTKQLPNDFDVRVSFRNLEKEGERQWGNGGNFGAGLAGPFFAVEPVDYQIREMEAVVGYTGDALQLSGGLYGTSFDNANKVANIAGGASAWDEMALPLDSESYQLFLSGAYSFSSSTQANFKLAYTEATQDDSFYTTPDRSCATTAPPCVSGNDLDAEVTTTLAYAAISSRPMDDLTFNANVRFEDRDDDTPEQFFLNPAVVSATRPNTNVAHSRETVNASAEAAYRLPLGLTVIGGVGFDSIDRSHPDPSATRYADNDETSYRVELRKSMHETLNGSLSYTYSERDSDNLRFSGNPPEDWVAPVHMSDRKRDKYKVRLDWAPTNPLSLQFVYEYSDDDYDLGQADFGVKSGRTELISLDVAYRVNEDWMINAWVSRDESEYDRDQGSPSGSGGLVNPWSSNLEYKGDAIGLGVRGLVAWQHRVGADLQYAQDEANYGINDPGGSPDLPDTEYKYWRAHLFGEYMVDDFSGFRADYIYINYDNNEWAWNDWIYADGTTVNLEENEDIHFIGLSYYYKWR